MNTVILTGNLTKKPEIRYTTGQNATAVCRFTLAVNEGYGDNQKTSFIPIVAFGKTAENCDKFLDKGSKVNVKGRIQTGSYEKEGHKVYTTDVIADSYGGVEFISKTQAAKNGPQEQQEVQGFTALQDDPDIPF